MSPSPSLVPDLPVLYSFRRCPYAIRARLALAASGVRYGLREISLRNKPPELLAASAKGTVPVLVLPDGSVVDESLAIMQWALAQHDPDGWLNPIRATLADALTLIAFNDGAFKHHLDRYKYPHRYPQVSLGTGPVETVTFAQTHRAGCAKWLTGLEPLLGDGCLAGAQVGLADMALLPFVRQCARTDITWFAAQPWPQVHRWLAAFEASARFNQVMDKTPAWQSLQNC